MLKESNACFIFEDIDISRSIYPNNPAWDGWTKQSNSLGGTLLPGVMTTTGVNIDGANAIDSNDCFVRCKNNSACAQATFNKTTKKCNQKGSPQTTVFNSVNDTWDRSTLGGQMLIDTKTASSTSLAETTATDAIACFERCKSNSSCVQATFGKANKVCYQKGSVQVTSADTNNHTWNRVMK
jgi:hypothetical protein